MQKTVNGVVQNFLWRGNSIAKEYRADSTVRADYQLGAGAKIDGKWQFYLSDIQGSTLAVADSSGKIIATWAYSDYGVTTQTSGDKNLYQPFLYTHSELDPETGYYHNKARHYAPGFGKFLARDPLSNSNLYSYCNGDPINFTDPDGMEPPEQVMDQRIGIDLPRNVYPEPNLFKAVGGATAVLAGGAVLSTARALYLSGSALNLSGTTGAVAFLDSLTPAVRGGVLTIIVHGANITDELTEGMISYVQMMQASFQINMVRLAACGGAGTGAPAAINEATGLAVEAYEDAMYVIAGAILGSPVVVGASATITSGLGPRNADGSYPLTTPDPEAQAGSGAEVSSDDT